MESVAKTKDQKLNFSFYIEDAFTHITAYPKAGKTSLAISLALDAILYCGKKVLFFTPGKERLTDIRHRMVAAIKKWGIDSIEEIRANKNDARHSDYNDIMLELFNLDIIIEPVKELSFAEFRRLCLYRIHHQRINLIIVDDFHKIKEGEQTVHLHELQRLATTLAIPCIVFTPLPSIEEQDLRRISQLNVRLDTCTNLKMWLNRPEYEIDAQLEVIESRERIQQSIPLSFNPRSGYFEDVEMIGLYLVNKSEIV